MKIQTYKNNQSITHYENELTENEDRNMCNILEGDAAKTCQLPQKEPSNDRKLKDRQSLASRFPPVCLTAVPSFSNCHDTQEKLFYCLKVRRLPQYLIICASNL